MAKPKNLEQLRAEKEQVETQLAQEQHKLERLENRKKYLEKGERQKRTHRLCNLGGTIESLAPEFKDLTRTEMTELMEHIFSLSEVQRAVRHMAITHISQANREKGDPRIIFYIRRRSDLTAKCSSFYNNCSFSRSLTIDRRCHSGSPAADDSDIIHNFHLLFSCH